MLTTNASAPQFSRSSPTSVRFLVLAVTTLMSVILYLDRFAVGIAAEYIREDLRMTQTQVAWFISAFFWSYALCQVPAGWLSDRFGARSMLTIYILGWSVFTGLMGSADAVWMMLWLRLFCGTTQAGAYPTSAALIRHWYPVSFRGTASSIVGLGGRLGAVLAPILTAWLMIGFVSQLPAPILQVSDILKETSFLAWFHIDQPPRSSRAIDEQRYRFAAETLDTLPATKRAEIAMAARLAAERVAEQADGNQKKTTSGFDLRDWIPRRNLSNTPAEGLQNLVDFLSSRMSRSDFIDLQSISALLPERGQALLARRTQGTSLSEQETIQLNRLALETMFRAEIRKFQGLGWRSTMVVYGLAGIIVAISFATCFSNSPGQHSWCNDAERELIREGAAIQVESTGQAKSGFPCRALVANLSLWGNSLTQFLTNVGWFFVVSYLPRYLEQIHRVPLVMQGIMTAFPSGAGIVGLFLGGRCTDWAVHRFGLKRGRRTPLVVSRFTAAAGYGLCLFLGVFVEPAADKFWLPWLYIAGLCLAAASTDFGSPAIWAYAQDVGGRYTGSILGWANMWGNIGAAIAPLVYNACLGETPTHGNWNSVFALCCGAFVLAGLFAMLLDATKPLTIDQ